MNELHVPVSDNYFVVDDEKAAGPVERGETQKMEPGQVVMWDRWDGEKDVKQCGLVVMEATHGLCIMEIPWLPTFVKRPEAQLLGKISLSPLNIPVTP